MVKQAIPDAGDIIWLDFDPQSGHEQAGYRSALVLSPAAYNGRIGLMLCCPITTKIKGYPFEVLIAGNPPSVVLSDRLKSLDWRHRNALKKGQVSAAELVEVRSKAKVLMGC